MYTRLPPTYELIEALQSLHAPSADALGAPTAPGAAIAAGAAGVPAVPTGGRAGQLLWAAFVVALLPTLATGGALLYWHSILRLPPPPWLPGAFHGLLAGSAICYLGAWGARMLASREALRHPLRWLSHQLDEDCVTENALLLRLGRIPPLQLRARQRRVVLQARMWEGTARTVALLLALGPAAFVLVDGLTAAPPSAGMAAGLVAIYGVVLVAGAAIALFAQLQCCGPLRRLAHVLGEAAEINEALSRGRAG